MKSFYRSIVVSAAFLTSAFASAKEGEQFFKDKDGFFFFIGVDHYESIHLVWDEIVNPNLKEFTLERSADGIVFSSLTVHSSSQTIQNVLQMKDEEVQQILSNPYNRLIYTTETGGGRFIYNQVIPDFLRNNKALQWYYRIKFSWKDGTVTYSGTRSFDFYFNYRKVSDCAHSHDGDDHGHDHGNSTSVKSINDGKSEIEVEESSGIFHQPDALKTGFNPPQPMMAPCPNVGTIPGGSCSNTAPVTLTGDCCTYQQRTYLVPNSNCMGTCCCNIDCSPSSWDTCCVHNCSQRSICGCVPWACCGGTNQNIVISKTNLTPAALSTSQTNINCNGQCTGSASVSTSGGTAPFTYSWSPSGGNAASANNLCAGTYSVTVTDANNCTSAVSVTITQPSVLSSSTSSTNALCGQSNGSASVTASGGSPAYTYAWSPSGGNSSSATGLSAGNYTVTVTDSKGCTSVATVAVNTIGSANAAFTNNTVCLGQTTVFTDQSTSTGSITNWNWNFGNGNTSTLQNPTQTYTASGTYTTSLTVTDNNGCVSTVNNVVTVNPQPAANFTSTTVCLGNATQFTNTSTGGGTSWSWNFGDGNTSTQQNPSNTYAAAGNYTATLTVTGPGGCASNIAYPVTVYPQPAAAFSATSVCLGQPTAFTDQSTGGASSWSWNFGDGNTSTSQNPSHTYTASGTYTATLNVTASPGGCISNATQVVTVYPQPVASFSATSVCINNPTQFTDLSTGGATAWSWNFGDGNTSTAQNPSNTYAAAGNYTVTLITTSSPGGCTNTVSLPVTVYPQASANFSATTVCVNTPSTQFTDLSGGASTWSWNFGDPNSGPNNTSSQQNPSHAYTAAGNYSVTLIVASGQGCADTVVLPVTVNPKPAAVISATTVCFNNATVFTDLSSGSPVSWNWDFGNGNNSVVQNPTHTYNAAGTYTATLIATDANGCKDTTSVVVTVNPLPMANFSSTTVCLGTPTCFNDLTTISSGSITGWSWNFGDPNLGPANISNNQNPCVTYTAAGSYVVVLTSTSNNGCQSTVNLPVTVNGPPVAAFTATNVCLNALTMFTNNSTGAVQWNWNFGDGGTSALQNPTHTYLGYGNYVVTLVVASAAGCIDTVIDTLTVYPLPVVSFSADTVCVGDPTTFADLSFVPSGNITTWSWNFGDPSSGANNTSNLQNPTHVFSAPGNFNVTLTVTSNNGCVSTVVLQALVFPLPVADFSYQPVSPLGLTDVVAFTDLSAGGVVQWSWLFGDGDSSFAQHPNHLYGDTGVYIITLSVIDNNGCKDTIRLPIEILDYTFYIPNAFTPNGDGTNDFFFGAGIGIKEYEMWIFDRWGNRIFYCKKEGLPQELPCLWNGKVDAGFSDEKVQEDVYVWKVRLINIFKKEFQFVGSVTVVK